MGVRRKVLQVVSRAGRTLGGGVLTTIGEQKDRKGVGVSRGDGHAEEEERGVGGADFPASPGFFVFGVK